MLKLNVPVGVPVLAHVIVMLPLPETVTVPIWKFDPVVSCAVMNAALEN
jgi:hypothetical protein